MKTEQEIIHKDRFLGVERLLGTSSLIKLQKAHVLIVGLGGVGSWTVESLARSGVGYLTLVDYDEICVTNTNRQIHALSSTVGQSKALALKERALDINPNLNIQIIEDFFSPDTAEQILKTPYDVIIDAIDALSAKALLVKICRERKIPLVVTGGAGGKTDPTRIQITDLAQTMADPLLQKLRKYLRQRFEFPRGKRSKFGIVAIYSSELPLLPETCESSQEVAGKLDCNTGYGTASYITATFGFFAAYKAIDILVSKKT